MQKYTVSTLGAGFPFSAALAEYLLERYGGSDELSRVLLLLPSRRACLAMREAFLSCTGGTPVLLPRMEALGDIDADLWMTQALFVSHEQGRIAPALPKVRQVMEMARLVHAFEEKSRLGERSPTMEHAVLLAEALLDLYEECARERIPASRLKDIVETAELARHWEVSLAFLEVILSAWPEREAELGVISRTARQDALLRQLSAHWRDTPPEHPVVAAGTTGSIPATAELLSIVAQLSQGHVILPGLDTKMEERAWQQVGPTHPQFVLKELLKRIGVERREVALLYPERASLARQAFLREVMLPPEATDRWRALDAELMEEGARGMTFVACDSQEHEAAAIALRMREVLMHPEKTAMLVTPDRNLAQRVSAMLSYYGIQIEDSSGKRLHRVTPAIFLQLVLECAASEMAPVELLALMRHPLFLMGGEGHVLRAHAREIERFLLRGVRHPDGMNGLLNAAQHHSAGLSMQALHTLNETARCLKPLVEILRLRQGREVWFSAILTAHLEAAEQLSENRLWMGHEGEKLFSCVGEIVAEASALEAIDPASYGGILYNMLGSAMYQPPYHGHPRLMIVSPLEARLQLADVVLLGGMNEGTWPPALQSDPWMNSQMRAKMGLPVPERAVGQSAHDVLMLCGAEEVFFTRAQKQGGTPSIPSRWWLRMQAVLGQERLEAEGKQWVRWAASLFSEKMTTPLVPPLPCPPVHVRPTTLWATQIGALMRDPYKFYAAHILRLKPLEELDAMLDASDFGKIVHAMLERFTQRYGNGLPENARQIMEDIGREELARHFHHLQVEAFWWPRIRRIAAWYVQEETKRRMHGMLSVAAESVASHILEMNGVRYAIQARIDRIEHYAGQRQLIVDYKTGAPPSAREIESGVACQLPVSAWILSGMQADCALMEPEYWKVSGARDAGNIYSIRRKGNHETMDELVMRTEEGLRRLLAFFADASSCYISCPDEDLLGAYNEFEHLERRGEWQM